MYKRIIFSIFCLFCSLSILESRQFDLWRTTIIAGAWTNVNVTTAPSYIYKIEIPTASAGSTFQMFGGTWSGNKYSTGTIYDTGNVQNIFYPLKSYTSGYMFTTVGNSTITVYWDYLFGSPKGQESKGIESR